MTQHTLVSRTEEEVTWYQRRSFLQNAAAWTALGGFSAAHAQGRTNVIELRGDAQINGQRLLAQQTIQTGDQLETGPGSSLIFVIGTASFQVRQNSRMKVERGDTLTAVSVLRLLTGAVSSVWGKGRNRQIITPTITAGIRGTGVYTEVQPDNGFRSYLCNCYGAVDIAAGSNKAKSQSIYHQSFWADGQANTEGRFLRPAKAVNHTDEELEFLARLIAQPTEWQITGKRGVMNGSGFPDVQPSRVHPGAAPVVSDRK
jgi:hypothetical protein